MSDIPLQHPYTPEFVEAQLSRAGLWRALWRIVQISHALLLGFLWRLVDGWPWTYRQGETRPDRQRRRAEWLRDKLTWLGPAFVKVGQSLATRPDLLPLVYLEVLASLHDRLPPFPNDVAFGFIEQELGWKPETLFEQFDPEPYAAASLGQVYRAVTHAGEKVAVKVQRPDLLQTISLDLALIRRFATLVERFPRLSRGQPWVSLVDEFGTKLFEELDYVHEAHLTERFRTNCTGLAGIYAPRVFWDYSSRRVLTTEFVEGIKVTDKAELAATGVDIAALLQQGVRANLKQLFEHGLFHADPHPGNLLVQPEDGTLVFIDFGMMGIIGPERQQRIVEMFVDVINRRPENLKENLIALGFLRPDARWDELVPLANNLFQSLFGSADRRHTFQDVTNSFAPLLYEYEFRIPVDFAYIVRAVMTLEGISLQLDSSFDIWGVSAPYAVRMMLSLPNPGLRQRLLDELLTKEGKLDWQRLQDLANLAAHETSFHLETEGLAEPALDMLLSAEGAAIRRALVADLLQAPEGAGKRIEALAPILTADPSLSGRAILHRLVAFILSPEGEEMRSQLALGLRSNGSFDVARAMEVLSLAGRLHPEFRAGTLIRSLGGYLLSKDGVAARNYLLVAGTQRLVDGLTNSLNRLTQPAPSPGEALAFLESE